MAVLTIPEEPTIDVTEKSFGDAPPIDDIDTAFEDAVDTVAPPTDEDYGAYVEPTNNVNATAGTYESGGTYSTPETTVSGQLTTLLDSASPYMKLAESKALSQANKMGLLSSSMAVGAGRRASIEAALPIAQQDAGTYADFMKQQQSFEGQGELARAGTLNEAELIGLEGTTSAALSTHKARVEQVNTNMNNTFTAVLQQANTEADALKAGWLSDVQGNWNNFTQQNLTQLQNEWQDRFNAQTMSQARYEIAMQSASQITQNLTTNITEILQDPDIMSGDPADIANMINNMISIGTSSIELVGNLGTVPPEELAGLSDQFTKAAEFTASSIPHDAPLQAPGDAKPEVESISDTGDFSFKMPDLDTSEIESATIHWGNRDSTEVENIEDLKTGVDYTYEEGLEGTNARVEYTLKDGTVVNEVFETTATSTPGGTGTEAPQDYAPEMGSISPSGDFSMALPDLDTSNITSAKIYWGDRGSTEVENLDDLKSGIDYNYTDPDFDYTARISYVLKDGTTVNKIFELS